ncbi:LLM class F420-dependent oxidoreductase [Dictyobacter vulcani]|uniref:LLM class F420-dependent oxidoreductase n=1 Tax=Dictyobacter vulcani TaxID=2607529 RepID=A0A5J4KJ23_9CHLR|nr:LLM class F420-dependent oxidoreductase [Dictyobacter vulcani]GER89708.1 LLM class F420-dependent oxidoreductase [Dictyobacter vulcani]
MKIGIMLPQEWEKGQSDPVEAYEHMTEVAQEAEALGFDGVWLFDHFYSTTSPELASKSIFECWMSTAALARDTSRIRIGQLVTCNSFRHPALLAKMASTVDVLSHGRLTVGIGAGWYEREYTAHGYEFPDIPTRLRQLGETAQVLKAMWTEQETFFAGKYIQIAGAINQPKGVQQPHIPLMIAGKGERVTLKLVARYGDACNFTHPTPEEMQHKFALIRQYCGEIGRDPAEIRRTIYVNGCVGETDPEAITKAQNVSQKFSIDAIRTRGLLGSPATIRQRLHDIEQLGVQEVIVSLSDVDLPSLRLLAQSFH